MRDLASQVAENMYYARNKDPVGHYVGKHCSSPRISHEISMIS